MPESDSPIERLAKRSQKAWSNADQHHSALKEAYLWLMPERYAEMNTASTSGGSKRGSFDHIFDPVGMQSLEDGASQIAEALHPWDQVWARWVPRMDVPVEQRTAIEKAGETFTDMCASMIARSNFDGAAVAAHKDFLLGTGFLVVDRDPWDMGRVHFTAAPAYLWAIEADTSGRIQAMFYKMVIRARDAEHTLPMGQWSPETIRLAQEQPDTDVEVEMAIYRQHDKGNWRTCYYEKATKHEVWAKVSRTSPVIVYRAGLVAGRAWGVGPGIKALPDVKVLNKVVELVLRNAAIAVTGIWQADDDGVLNPNTVRLVPGTIITKAMGSDGLQPLASPGDFNVAELILNDLRVNVRRAFYVTRVEEREMTAEEYSGRLRQQMREQRGVYGQLKEFVEQLYLRLMDLAVEMGMTTPSAFEQMAQIELTGPLALDARGAAVDRLKQMKADLDFLFSPEIALAAFKPEVTIPWVGEQRHANSDAVRTKEDLIQLSKQVLSAAATMQAQQQAGVAP